MRRDQHTGSWGDRFAHDVAYIDSWSLWLDIRILAKTLLQVVRREGIAEEGHATRAPFTGS